MRGGRKVRTYEALAYRRNQMELSTKKEEAAITNCPPQVFFWKETTYSRPPRSSLSLPPPNHRAQELPDSISSSPGRNVTLVLNSLSTEKPAPKAKIADF
jgi:hypothetical protein